MKSKKFVLSFLLSLSISCIALGDRQLDRTEILEIFKKLTSQSQTTWISEGTIEASHEEYRASKTNASNIAEINQEIAEKIREYQDNPDKRELTAELRKMRLAAIPFNVRYKRSNSSVMSSSVVVKYDGEKFYWEIDVSSRTDSVKPDASLEYNYLTDEFNLDYNQRRIFAWDGQKYTCYFLPGNHAVVDTTGSMPRAVNGPLTAGCIPWGYGNYSYESLSTAKVSGEEKIINDQTQIEITVDHSDGSEMKFVLDPQKDYAVNSCSIDDLDTIVSSVYGDYQKVSGKWVPSNISIERHDSRTNKQLSYDIWSFSSISDKTPSGRSFNVEFYNDAMVEYISNVTNSPVMYNHSYAVDTDKLLLDRLTYAASEGTQLQNCATAALKYTIGKSGKDVSDEQLARLVSKKDKATSLYKMKKFAQGKGLHCRAVKLGIGSLGKLQGCEAILHLPKKNHFVVLGEIDERFVGSIDLSSKKFYSRKETGLFDMDWADGVALLVSNQPINIEDSVTEIPNSGLQKITGGNGWQCIDLLQEEEVQMCDSYSCSGYYEIYYERWGCKYVGSGYCAHSSHTRKLEGECVMDIYGNCKIGEWTEYNMWSCD